MVVSLTRMLKSFGQAQDDLPTLAAKNAQEMAISQDIEVTDNNSKNNDKNDQAVSQRSVLTPPERSERICDALAQVSDIRTPTPLTDRYLSNRAQMRPTNRPPFDPDTLWYLKHGRCPIMTELVDVVDEATLNAMPIEAVAILDRINGKLKRYREWSSELNEQSNSNIMNANLSSISWCQRAFQKPSIIMSNYSVLVRTAPKTIWCKEK